MFRKKRTVNLKLWASRLLKSWGTRIYNFCIWSSRSWTSLWSWGLNLLTQPRRASWSFGRSGPCFLGQEWRPTFYFFLGSECLRLRGKRTLTGAPLRERLNRKKKKRMRLNSERKKEGKQKGDVTPYSFDITEQDYYWWTRLNCKLMNLWLISLFYLHGLDEKNQVKRSYFIHSWTEGN